MAITAAGLSLEEFLRLPEEEPALEYADGVVTQKVSPRGKHSALQVEIVQRIQEAGRPGKIARAFTELRATFAGFSPVPDIAVYRWDRIPLDAAGQIADQFTVAPDIAIEIVSPDQRLASLVRRCLWFVANGVQVALLIDPEDQTVFAFRPERQVTALRGADRIDLDEMLPSFKLTVEQLFATLRHP